MFTFHMKIHFHSVFPIVHAQETKTFHSNVRSCGVPVYTNTYTHIIWSIASQFYGKLFQTISSEVIRYLWFYKCQTAKVKTSYPIRHIRPRHQNQTLTDDVNELGDKRAAKHDE